MLRQSSISRCAFALLTVFTALAHAHTVITYPGWRGDNLHSSGTVEQTDGMIQAASNNSDSTDGTYWPYGMQWEYPCKSLLGVDAHPRYQLVDFDSILAFIDELPTD